MEINIRKELGQIYRQGRTIGIVIGLISTLTACALSDIQQQIEIAENAGSIRGSVNNQSHQDGQVVVVSLRDEKGLVIVTNRSVAYANGEFNISVAPGNYYLGAFIDRNKDGIHEADEYGNFFGKPTAIVVNPGKTVNLEVITITNEPPLLPDNIIVKEDLLPAVKDIGRVVSLDDPIFDDANYPMGLWKPVNFLNQVGGGLFFLQEYSKHKIPVLFIHGINGGPHNFTHLIDSIDKEHYQPWVIYYPSGLRLDMVSDYLVKAITELQNRYEFKHLYLVAHSMGGLVMRSFVKKYSQAFPQLFDSIDFAMTINSPMNGMASAEWGVEMGYLVVPSWRDVATNSAFIQDLFTWRWPHNIPYYVIFSYQTGKSEDGVVTLQSQIPLQLQQEASKIYGFNNSHSGVLADPQFLGEFNAILRRNLNVVQLDSH